MNFAKFKIILFLFFYFLFFSKIYAVDNLYKIDINYKHNISGKVYKDKAAILRNAYFVKKHNLKIGQVILSIPEFRIHNIKAYIIKIKKIKLNLKKSNHESFVTGFFKRYVKVVKIYKFKNKNNKIFKIIATPNHRFYIINKHKFVALKNITYKDLLVNNQGENLKLICKNYINKDCGALYNKNPVAVYNIEIYKDHKYFVGNAKILAHNVCEPKIYNGNFKIRRVARKFTNEDYVYKSSAEDILKNGADFFKGKDGEALLNYDDNINNFQYNIEIHDIGFINRGYLPSNEDYLNLDKDYRIELWPNIENSLTEPYLQKFRLAILKFQAHRKIRNPIVKIFKKEHTTSREVMGVLHTKSNTFYFGDKNTRFRRKISDLFLHDFHINHN